ncbi:carbamoyltransferase C-terminal domain-containing protein [Prochlorococcus sp. MIT 0801]|uniref:carbamoyltransferase C-terminal domain-containing protein n=1 Tax=Prochlorococcus sp. MIT 0801 TaxID=1501269 RepID=UPI0004F59FB6|nr:carbamoyltransferase C-terminal domain-containing protein [Prochlorococcus sp. MIT 0801]AIQ97402.1 Carbamoyltransferase [Prochlorococcus sp. MIT 0801]
MNVIVGINNSHNGSVALLCDGEVKVAIQAERISRYKRQSLPLGDELELAQRCLNYCLNYSGLKLEDINAIALSTPWKVKKISNELLFKYIGGVPKNYFGTYYVPHHLSHMEYILHYGFSKPGIVLVIDGSGSLVEDKNHFNIKEKYHSKIINFSHFCGKEVISAYWFDGKESHLIYKFSPSIAAIENYNSNSKGFLQSIGHYWDWASLYCCGKRSSAGKVMGLAAYGEDIDSNENDLLSISDSGKITLDFSRINQIYNKPNIFSLDLSDSIHHINLANRVQSETENVILKLLDLLKSKYPCENLYLSGGVALNVVANEKIKKSNLFKSIILNGSVEDNGTAIGAAIAVNQKMSFNRKFSVINDYYGITYNEQETINELSNFDLKYEVLSNDDLFAKASNLIHQEKVIAWFQGKSEFGPRALGNRSILANPSCRFTKYLLDHYMKCRDRYRPYAPVVIEERANLYFDMNDSSPVMMRNVKVLDKRLIAVQHIDGTARVQTVNEKQNKILYKLLIEVEKLTGIPILLNTSFNLPGEPIVESPKDALSSFSRGNLDYLFIGNLIIYRN